MNATDALSLLTEIIFVLLGVITLVDFLRHRDRTRRDIALMFGSLTASIVIGLFTDITQLELPWLNTLGSLAVIAQPYLLLRLVAYFRPVSITLRRAALAGMVLSWVAILIFATTPPPLVTLLVVVYFAGIDGYAMAAFVRGALTTSGVVRQRLRFAASGSGLLALALVMAGAALVIPAIAAATAVLVQVMAILCAVTYYLGFAPPRWLRRAWQLNELRNFMLQTMVKPATARLSAADNLNQLVEAAKQAVGGTAAAAVQPDPSGSGWIVRQASDPALFGVEIDHEGALGSVWRQRAASSVTTFAGSERERRLLQAAGVDTLLIVPMDTREHQWGLLLVFLRFGSLFLSDDLDLLTLLAQQTAIILENNALADELRVANEELERKVAERTAELQQAADELRLLNDVVEQGTQPFALADLGGRMVRFNRAFESLTGYDADELKCMGYPQLTSDESREAEAGQWSRLIASGRPARYEKGYRRKDGSTVPTDSVVDLYRNEAGEAEYVVSFVSDITERKRAEDEIRQLNADLERRILERTGQLHAVNKELEAFSYSVSHDLRSPLRALDGFSQALQEDYGDRLDADGLRYLERIRTASQRMGQLIDDLLQLSRLTRAELKHEPLDLSVLARQIVADLKEKYADHAIEFVIPDQVPATGDLRFLRVALVNLLDNACKYSSKKDAPRVEFGVAERDGRPVYFVRDNGAGFDMAYANKLFGAFQRLHSGTEFEGTGIGLATVQRIISRHGGEIWAESALGQGACFYFTLA